MYTTINCTGMTNEVKCAEPHLQFDLNNKQMFSREIVELFSNSISRVFSK